MKVVRHWNSFAREVVDVPCLQKFKTRLDEALSTWLSGRYPCLWQRSWNKMRSKVPSTQTIL